MLMQSERESIVRTGRLLFDKGLVQLSGGNISIRDPKTNYVAIKPSGVAYIDMTPEQIIIMDLDMNVIEGTRKPSIESKMHTGIYKARSDIQAVVHCHPPFAVAWSIKGNKFLRSVIAAMYTTNGAVMIAPYEPAGSQALADSAVKAIGKDYAAILQSHGIICGGRDMKHALEMAFVIEDAAKISCIAEMLPGETCCIDEQLGQEEGIDTMSKLMLK
jgi:L-ribulose-5-phosphate 4-epimerase